MISGQDTSKWLRAFQKASRFVVEPYLEDEEQVDQVYRYLDELLRNSPHSMPSLANLERIPFILDVLLPEVSPAPAPAFKQGPHQPRHSF